MNEVDLHQHQAEEVDARSQAVARNQVPGVLVTAAELDCPVPCPPRHAGVEEGGEGDRQEVQAAQAEPLGERGAQLEVGKEHAAAEQLAEDIATALATSNERIVADRVVALGDIE